MRRFPVVAVALLIAVAVAGLAVAGGFEHSGSLKSGATSYTMTVTHPKKIELYPEAQNGVRASYSIVCLKGTTVSHFSRSFDTPFTRNLLWHIPAHQDVCYIAVAGATTTHVGQIVVQASN